jgi:hypothetical protein
MTPDPIELALREIADTKHLLEALITSSEAFDYPSAKVALGTLRKKVRTLGRLQAELSAQRGLTSDIIIRFPEAGVPDWPPGSR